tara:strand:+ start:2149 stop:2817 length:669 start_codon:yes stop_codon:yes gene_type:complete
MRAWSYSSLNTFKQCPKKYYHLKVLRDVKDTGSSATVYGSEVHKAAEEFMRSGTPVPKKFAFMDPVLKSLSNIRGEKLCELELGVAKTETGYAPTGFSDEGAWWRGIADLVILDGEKAYSVDYKTSKSAKYADTKQLDAVAAALFTNYPQLKVIKSALAFVVSRELVTKDHHVAMRDAYFASFNPDLDRLAGAEKSGVWNATSSPLCGYCPVTSCEHYRKRR